MATRKPPAAGKGRPKGSPNKVTAEVRAAATRLVTDPVYRKALRLRLRSGTAGAIEALLWHYAYGKPKEQVEVTGTDGAPIGPITFVIKGRSAA